MSDRNLNPHAEARIAMMIWSHEYAYEQRGGSMDFWDSRTPGQKKQCVEIVDKLLASPRADGSPPAQTQVQGDAAVLAERQRCAEIASREATKRFENADGYPAARVHDFLVVARAIERGIRLADELPPQTLSEGYITREDNSVKPIDPVDEAYEIGCRDGYLRAVSETAPLVEVHEDGKVTVVGCNHAVEIERLNDELTCSSEALAAWVSNCRYLLDIMDNQGIAPSDLGEDDEGTVNEIRGALEGAENRRREELHFAALKAATQLPMAVPFLKKEPQA